MGNGIQLVKKTSLLEARISLSNTSLEIIAPRTVPPEQLTPYLSEYLGQLLIQPKKCGITDLSTRTYNFKS